jgi:hypothetical protein
MRWHRLAVWLLVGSAAIALIAGCSSGTTTTPAPTSTPAGASPTVVPSFPPELTGLWAGDWLYMGKVAAEVAFTIHPCGVSGTQPVDVGCGHLDYRQPDSPLGPKGCIQTLAYLGTEGDAFAFQERTAYVWGDSDCGVCRVNLTPMPDGTLDAKEDCGPYATLHRIAASPAPSGG